MQYAAGHRSINFVPKQQVPTQWGAGERLGPRIAKRKTRAEISARYKTELCRNFMESKFCPYGDRCEFAHGLSELRSLGKGPKRKIAECRAFHECDLICYYGQRCRFAHTKESVCEAHEKGGEEGPFYRLKVFTNISSEAEEEKDAEQFVSELLQEYGIRDIQRDSFIVEDINILSPTRVVPPNELTSSTAGQSDEKNTNYLLLTPPLLRFDQNSQLPLSPLHPLIYGEMNLTPPLNDIKKGSFGTSGKQQLNYGSLSKPEINSQSRSNNFKAQSSSSINNNIQKQNHENDANRRTNNFNFQPLSTTEQNSNSNSNSSSSSSSSANADKNPYSQIKYSSLQSQSFNPMWNHEQISGIEQQNQKQQQKYKLIQLNENEIDQYLIKDNLNRADNANYNDNQLNQYQQTLSQTQAEINKFNDILYQYQNQQYNYYQGYGLLNSQLNQQLENNNIWSQGGNEWNQNQTSYWYNQNFESAYTN